MFNWSIMELLDKYLVSEKLKMAILGQGVIGTTASPFEKGTAYVYFHHYCGKVLRELPGRWHFVLGGMGRISALICEAAKEFGATITTGADVVKIKPGEYVRVKSGEKTFEFKAPVIVSNADPTTTLRLLGDDAEENWRKCVQRIPNQGSTGKINLITKELLDLRSRPGNRKPQDHHLGEIEIPIESREEWMDSYQCAKNGILPKKLWLEMYCQTARDQTITENGLHHVSILAQYVPYAFKVGTWDENREKVKQLVIDQLKEHFSNVDECLVHVEVLGPPDIEKEINIFGGHIFHGEILPPFMWDKRLASKTSMKGFFMCGAGTHPGGSVISINGRNAAMQIINSECL
eukprot:TRINITY_DN6222_c0_g1_i5.p1 TRINITY_DN6222_c0_g1~~TRINITY_DN6222_c0_g1_i5.p1  ORF type:complete len:348 (-),score=34.99 TRINITY_DN6222_c0_g1_i5:47-1090(-)